MGAGPGSARSPGALPSPLAPGPRLLKGPLGLRSRAWNLTSGKPSEPQRSAPGDPSVIFYTRGGSGRPGPRARASSLHRPGRSCPPPHPTPAVFTFVPGPARLGSSYSSGAGTSAPREPRPRRRFALGIRASPLHEPWRWEPGSAFYGVGGGVGAQRRKGVPLVTQLNSGGTWRPPGRHCTPSPTDDLQPLSLPLKVTLSGALGTRPRRVPPAPVKVVEGPPQQTAVGTQALGRLDAGCQSGSKRK